MKMPGPPSLEGGDPAGLDLPTAVGDGPEESAEVLRLRSCLSQGALAFLLLISLGHAVTLLGTPQWIFDPDEPFFLEVLDQLAFQAMLLGFAGVLWRPARYRPFLLLGKAGFCFELGLGTGGQSFSELGPRLAAIAFMGVAMWHLLSRLGVGVWNPSAGHHDPPF